MNDAQPSIEVLLPGYTMDTDQGTGGFCAVILIEGVDGSGAHRRLLVDPAHVGRRAPLAQALAGRGLGPADIDGVVLTHAHWDHMQNVDVFGHATLMLHPDERAYSQHPHPNDFATPAWTGAIIERRPIVEVTGGDQLLEGVHIVDLPGHSAGSIGVSVTNSDGVSVVAGDALLHARVALSRRTPLVMWDTELARQSIGHVLDLADVIYPGHDRIFRITRSGTVQYLEPFNLTFKNIAQDREHIAWDMSDPGQEVMPGIEGQL
ncbi:MAG: MBL fold metallo-hydrolase, partial [Sciscionella sp.]